MSDMNKKITDAMNWRYAAQLLDPEHRVSDEDMNTILEAGRLAPSAFGVEPWHFILIENKELQKRLYDEASQQDKVKDAPHFLVVAKRTDGRETLAAERIARTVKATGMPAEAFKGLEDAINEVIDSKNDAELDTWVTGATFIPLGAMIETAALLGVDSGPMEGFDHDKFDEILDLKSKNLASVYAIAFGYRINDAAAERPKVRRSLEEVVTRL